MRYVGLFLFLPKEESRHHPGGSAGDRCALCRKVECDEMTGKEKRTEQTSNEVIFEMKKSIFASYDELPLPLNVKQLADLLGVSDSSVYELIQEVDFPSLRIGKRIVVPKE